MIDTVYDGKHERRATSRGHLERLYLDGLSMDLGESLQPYVCSFREPTRLKDTTTTRAITKASNFDVFIFSSKNIIVIGFSELT